MRSVTSPGRSTRRGRNGTTRSSGLSTTASSARPTIAPGRASSVTTTAATSSASLAQPRRDMIGGEAGGAGSRVAVTHRSCSLNMRERCEDRSCEQWGRMRSDMAPESRQRWFAAVVAAAVAAVWVRRVVLPARPRSAPLPIPLRIPDPDERPAPDGTGVRIVVNPSSGPAWTDAPTDALREGLPGADIHELDPDDELERPAVPRRPRRHRRGGRRRHPRRGRHHRGRA